MEAGKKSKLISIRYETYEGILFFGALSCMALVFLAMLASVIIFNSFPSVYYYGIGCLILSMLAYSIALKLMEKHDELETKQRSNKESPPLVSTKDTHHT